MRLEGKAAPITGGAGGQGVAEGRRAHITPTPERPALS